LSRLVRAPVVVLAGAWLAYEVYMAFRPPKPFSSLDYVALAFKLMYLSGLLACSIRCRLDDVDYYIIYSSPLAAIAVRLAGGWLSYTLFTVILPVLALASNLPRRDPLAALSSAATLVVMAAALPGSLYRAPENITWDSLAALAVAYPASVAAALRGWRIRWNAILWSVAPLAGLALRILVWIR